jgi:hypothetical protein
MNLRLKALAHSILGFGLGFGMPRAKAGLRKLGGSLCFFFECRRLQATTSRFNLWVLKAAHVLVENRRNSFPKVVVTLSRIFRIGSVCIQSLASLCQNAIR